jgi:ribosome biogenesis ATPase
LIGGRLADRAPLGADELVGLAITAADFAEALTRVQPSAQREGFTTTPEVTWEDVGSLTEVREELAFSVVEPIAHPKRFHAMGLAASTGVLLYGPPGCGKTLVAKATANEAQANFISIKGPELLNKYVGESERAVRTLFARARAASPCVLFFDELDSLAPRRGGEGNQASERVVNQLLTEMDGLESRSATFVVAATNRPDMIDPAMLRPGRLDKLLYVPLPPPDGRAAILKTLTRKTPLAPEVDVDAIAFSSRCSGFSGADLASLVREACVAALKGNMAAFALADAAEKKNAAAGKAGDAPAPPLVTSAHFDAAFARVQPSVSSADQRRYDELRRKLRKERGSIAAPGLDREGGANVGRGSEGGMTLEPGPGEDGVGRRAGSAKKRKA